MGELKELWLSPRIAEHDLQVRLNRTEEFLQEGHKVKLTVKFKGREIAYPQLGYQVLEEALRVLGVKAIVERDAKFEGKKLSMIIGKNRGGKTDAETKNQKINI